MVLRSIGPSGYSWEAGRNEAVCLLTGRRMQGQPRHRAPAMNCGCGLYAVHDVDRFSGFTNLDSDSFVLAGVAGTGIVRVHTAGWRAQFARIVAFSVELPEIPLDLRLALTERQILKLVSGVAPEQIRQIESKAIQKARHPSRSKEAQGRLSATAAEALGRKYQVPVVPLDKLKEVMAGVGNFWEEMR